VCACLFICQTLWLSSALWDTGNVLTLRFGAEDIRQLGLLAQVSRARRVGAPVTCASSSLWLRDVVSQAKRPSGDVSWQLCDADGRPTDASLVVALEWRAVGPPRYKHPPWSVRSSADGRAVGVLRVRAVEAAIVGVDVHDPLSLSAEVVCHRPKRQATLVRSAFRFRCFALLWVVSTLWPVADSASVPHQWHRKQREPAVGGRQGYARVVTVRGRGHGVTASRAELASGAVRRDSGLG
jgi:hypothetical protein